MLLVLLLLILLVLTAIIPSFSSSFSSLLLKCSDVVAFTTVISVFIKITNLFIYTCIYLLPSFILGSIKNCLGDLTSGRAFDNGCCCFDSEEARCNSLRGKTIECHCGVSTIMRLCHT